MGKYLLKTVWALLFACAVGIGLTACADAEDGESWGDWEFRNAISNGKYTSWSIFQIKDENGNWVEQDANTILYFDIQFFVNEAEKAFLDDLFAVLEVQNKSAFIRNQTFHAYQSLTDEQRQKMAEVARWRATEDHPP